MNRRALLTTGAVWLTGLAGCLGQQDGGFGGSEEEQADTDSAGGLSETQQAFRDQLDEDLTVSSISTTAAEIVVTAQTSGDIGEDMRLAAQAYVNFHTQLDRDLRISIEDRGLTKATFVVKRQWAEAFANDQIDDAQYLSRISDTRTG